MADKQSPCLDEKMRMKLSTHGDVLRIAFHQGNQNIFTYDASPGSEDVYIDVGSFSDLNV